MYVNIYIYIYTHFLFIHTSTQYLGGRWRAGSCTDFGHACLKDLSNTLWAMAKLEMAHLSLLDAAASLVDAACYYTRT